MLRQFFSFFMPRLHWQRWRGLASRAVTAFSQWLRAPGPSFTLPPPATHWRRVRSRGLHVSSLEHESPAVRQSHCPANTSQGTPAHRRWAITPHHTGSTYISVYHAPRTWSDYSRNKHYGTSTWCSHNNYYIGMVCSGVIRNSGLKCAGLLYIHRCSCSKVHCSAIYHLHHLMIIQAPVF